MWSSGSAGMSRCRPTWPPAAGCRSSSTRPTPRPGWPTRSAPGSPSSIAAAVDGSGLKGARVVGNPVRRSLSELDRAGAAGAGAGVLRPRPGRADPAGVRRLAGRAADQRRGRRRPPPDLAEVGIGVLHAYGRKNELDRAGSRRRRARPTSRCPYLDRMDLAYSAADLVLARSGAMTVAEIAAVGLPAVYVPLPHGNGEQRLNASAQVASGAAIIIDDADLDRETVVVKVIPLVIDGIMRDGMTASAAPDRGATRRRLVARMVLDACRPAPSCRTDR